MGSQMAKDASTTGRRPDGSKATVSLNAVAVASGWPTTTSRDGKECPNVPLNALLGRVAWLSDNDSSRKTVALSGWPTPEAEEARRGYQNRSNGKKGSQESMTTTVINALGDKPHLLPHGPARITADGIMLTGSSAEMESGGQLNPAFSAWLMGFPEAWCKAAISCQLPTRSRKRPVA